MPKADDKTQEELPADKLKREAAEKAAAEEAAKQQPELSDEAKKAQEAILNGPADDEGDGADEEDGVLTFQDADPNDKRAKANAAAKKLRLIAVAYPLTTPDEHVVFGFGGHRFQLGELRALFDLQRTS